MNEEKYKLRLTITTILSARKSFTVTRSFVWDKEEDAKACQALLERADRNSREAIRLEFIRFVPEKPL